jgi:exopolysaccharide biosynthesis polyprenyl glycosylphosphotransferase
VDWLTRHRLLVTVSLALLDIACIVAAYLYAIRVTLPADAWYWDKVAGNALYLVIFGMVWSATASDNQYMISRRSEDLGSYMSNVVRAVADAMMFSIFVITMLALGSVERQFLVYLCVSTLVAVVSFRVLARIGLMQLRRLGLNVSDVLVVGANERSANLIQTLAAHPTYGLRVRGFIEDDPARIEELTRQGIAHLGGFSDLEQVVRDHGINEVYVSLPVRSYYETIQVIADACGAMNVPARLVADLFPLRIASNKIFHVEDVPLLSLSAVPEAQVKLTLKRAEDFIVSSLILVLGAPIWLTVALIIKLDSPGPVFFFQERVGQNQRRFYMIKFRSMVVNAEALRAELETHNEADGPVFKIRNDPRLTRVGRFIRKYSIDEFPQLINVWKGEMSLVGPRPPIPKEVAEYSWDQRRRLSVKPGMTGLWQVSGRSDVTFHEWVWLDLQYIDNWSLFQDLKILFQTFGAVVKGRGAA